MSEEFQVTASLKGAIGETLLTEHKSAVQDYFIDWCVSDLKENNPEWVPDTEYRVVFDIGRSPHSYDVSIDGDFATWYPDALYELTFNSSYVTGQDFDRYTVEFPVEVKTGQSSELSDNQRAVMATIEQQSNPIFPIRVRVDVSDLPGRFNIVPHRIQHRKDTSLPEYSTEGTPKPEETKPDSTETSCSSLSEFQDNTESDLEEYVSAELAEAINEVSDNHTSSFTVEEIITVLDRDITEEEVRAGLDQLAFNGQIYEGSPEQWKSMQQE
ncbi:hypothetical protein [Haloplanus sp. C73]|uniref:hypothetical protein n=1 Tax=Haloplanus sp. C73 TaxID=3421641 RepID=UPI003EB9EAAC